MYYNTLNLFFFFVIISTTYDESRARIPSISDRPNIFYPHKNQTSKISTTHNLNKKFKKISNVLKISPLLEKANTNTF